MRLAHTGYHVLIASITDAMAVTAFFVPGIERRRQETEYGRLRGCAHRATGSTPSDIRIHGLACRLGGRDCTIEVGQSHPIDGSEVLAILDLGRQLPYGVFTSADPDAPALLIRKQVYSVTEFG